MISIDRKIQYKKTENGLRFFFFFFRKPFSKTHNAHTINPLPPPPSSLSRIAPPPCLSRTPPLPLVFLAQHIRPHGPSLAPDLDTTPITDLHGDPPQIWAHPSRTSSISNTPSSILPICSFSTSPPHQFACSHHFLFFSIQFYLFIFHFLFIFLVKDLWVCLLLIQLGRI